MKFSKKADIGTPSQPPSPEERGAQEISKYSPEYEFLVKLVQLVTKEGVPPQEIKALAEAHPFVTVDDVGDLTAQIWTLATQKYQIPNEWLIGKLPKSASLHKEAWPSHGYWVDPNGKVYTIRGAHGGGKTHSDWVKINKKLLIEQYGISQDLFGGGDMYSVECEMIEKGWVKFGDSVSDDARWAVKVNNYKRIPSFVEDFLSQFVPAESVLEIGDLNEDIAFIKWPVNNLQRAVNREIMHPTGDRDASLKKADLWPSQEQSGDMLSHDHNSLSYNPLQEPDTSACGPRPDEVKTAKPKKLNINKVIKILEAKEPRVSHVDFTNNTIELADGTLLTFDEATKRALEMDKTADVFQGSEFSGTDAEPNPLTDIGPYSSPEDHGKKPQKSPFPNTNWLPADDENLDQQPASNVAASLKKQALAQQDVVDFYLLSLLPAEYLEKEVTPDHYDALAIFKTIIMSLRDEYIERGMDELKDEAETTAWTKAIRDDKMPEQIKKYYTFHDTPFPGSSYSSHSDDEDEARFPYHCESCGGGLTEDDAHNFGDYTYCESCEIDAIDNVIAEDVSYCETHNVFVSNNTELQDYVYPIKFKDPREHPEGEEHKLIRYSKGKPIWDEIQENAKNQLRLQFEERKKRREQKQVDLPLSKHNPEDLIGIPESGTTSSLKQAGEGAYSGSGGWWQAPTDFDGYTAQDFYTIFKYAPWKYLYGGPLWAEVARTVYEMQQTTQWDKLVVLIDHYHDLGHNTGKLLDKFPEWHQWFKRLLDMKAQKNSLRYLLPKASKPVQNLVTEFLRVHGRDWRADEGKPKAKGVWEVGDEVFVPNTSDDPKHKRFHPATIIDINEKDDEFHVQYENGATDWFKGDALKSPQFSASSLNRPFSKKALLKEANPTTRYWIAPDGTEFDAGTHHGAWVTLHKDILKKYGINTSKNLYEMGTQMYSTGWTRVSNEPAGTGFTIEVADLRHIPSYLDNFIAKNFSEGDRIVIGNQQTFLTVENPFPSIQKAVNKQLMRKASLKRASVSGQAVNEILQSIESSGGCTFNFANGNLTGTDNYAVSIYPIREKIVNGIVDFEEIENYVVENEDLLKDPANSFGAWSHDGKVYLDVVATLPDQEKALELGRINKQIAIWDLKNNQEIPVKSSARAMSKKDIVKTAEEEILSQDDQNEIAAASSPVYVIALNNYAEAVKRGHDKDRALAYAVESVQNLDKIDQKKLVEFINNYL